MSTRASISGVSGTEPTPAEWALGRAKFPWDFIPFRLSFEISVQATVPAKESVPPCLIALSHAGRSIPVDGAAGPVHPGTTSATMIAQVIRSAVGFQALLMSDDVSMMNALAADDTTLHSNDNVPLGASIARVTVSA
jgi:hypothetical protein